MEELVREFSSSVTDILNMRVRDFIDRYRDFLPRFAIAHHASNVGRVLGYIKDGRDYVVVVDDEGVVRGVLAPIDIVEALRLPGRGIVREHMGAAFATVPKVKVTPRGLMRLELVNVMNKHPPVVEEDARVEEVMELMGRERANYVVVVDRRGKVRAVLTAHALLRAITGRARTVFEMASRG